MAWWPWKFTYACKLWGLYELWRIMTLKLNPEICFIYFCNSAEACRSISSSFLGGEIHAWHRPRSRPHRPSVALPRAVQYGLDLLLLITGRYIYSLSRVLHPSWDSVDGGIGLFYQIPLVLWGISWLLWDQNPEARHTLLWELISQLSLLSSPHSLVTGTICFLPLSSRSPGNSLCAWVGAFTPGVHVV